MKKLLYAAFLGAFLWILSEILEMASPLGSTPLSLWITTLWHPILALGFWGLHQSQSPHKNRLSLIGVVLLIISLLGFAPVSLLILQSDLHTFSEFLQENPVFQVFGLFSIFGYVLFGWSVIRTGYYPRWTGYALILTVLLSVFQNFLHWPEVIQHLAFIGLSMVIIALAFWGLRKELT